MFARNPSAIAGSVLLLIVLLVAIVGPWVYPVDPFEIIAAPMTPPLSEDAWLGTDYLGRDVLITLIYGGRATLLVGAVAALLSVTIGITLGATAGFYGGRVDNLLMRITEFFQVLPALSSVESLSSAALSSPVGSLSSGVSPSSSSPLQARSKSGGSRSAESLIGHLGQRRAGGPPS